jgi:hypothetical protein
MKKAIGFVVGSVVAVSIISAACGNTEDIGVKTKPAQVVKQETPAKETTVPEQPKEEKKEEPKSSTFAFGAEVPFESGLSVKAVSVTETKERNQFADPTNHVVIVSFEFTNNTGAELTITSNDFQVLDSTGFQGVTYPQGDQIVTITAGSKARAQFHYGVEAVGPYKVIGGVATWQ